MCVMLDHLCLSALSHDLDEPSLLPGQPPRLVSRTRR
jgi:hypothetical protein